MCKDDLEFETKYIKNTEAQKKQKTSLLKRLGRKYRLALVLHLLGHSLMRKVDKIIHIMLDLMLD